MYNQDNAEDFVLSLSVGEKVLYKKRDASLKVL